MPLQSARVPPLLRRMLALVLLPASAAAAPCNVTDRTILGSWERVGRVGAFEQMAFEIESSQREFNSWLHERPEVSQAQWQLDDCKLTIRESSNDARTFTALLRGKQLVLSGTGGKAAGTYRRIEVGR